MVTFSDEEIKVLIRIPKKSTAKRPGLPSLRRKRGHVEAQMDFQGDDSSVFRVVLRRSLTNPFAFSAILIAEVGNPDQFGLPLEDGT